MALIEQVRPDFMYSLHNSDFGGVYFYLWEESPPLYEPFHKLVESQGLPLHQGESERPYEIEYANAIYKDSSLPLSTITSKNRPTPIRPRSSREARSVLSMPGRSVILSP